MNYERLHQQILNSNEALEQSNMCMLGCTVSIHTEISTVHVLEIQCSFGVGNRGRIVVAVKKKPIHQLLSPIVSFSSLVTGFICERIY